MTIQNLGSKGTAVDILANDVVASTANGSGVDLQGYEGEAAFIRSSRHYCCRWNRRRGSQCDCLRF